MIIKLYSLGLHQTLDIIENLSDISIEKKIKHNDDDVPVMNFTYGMGGQEFKNDLPYIMISALNKQKELVRIRVYNYAYICNDEGKTIEKICVSDYNL